MSALYIRRITIAIAALALALAFVAREARAEEANLPFARLWVGLATSVDVVYLGPTADVCALGPTFRPANKRGYYCTNPDGTDFPSRQTRAEEESLVSGRSGRVLGAPSFGDVRLLASFDYAVRPDLLLGARVGAVFYGYAGTAAVHDGRALGAPLHLELRATYLVGDRPLARSGLAPLLLADAGVAPFDARQTVQVRQSTIAGDRPKVAWRTGGPGFIGAGAGVRYALSPRIAVSALARVAIAVDAGGVFPAIVPEIGLQYGF